MNVHISIIGIAMLTINRFGAYILKKEINEVISNSKDINTIIIFL